MEDGRNVPTSVQVTVWRMGGMYRWTTKRALNSSACSKAVVITMEAAGVIIMDHKTDCHATYHVNSQHVTGRSALWRY